MNHNKNYLKAIANIFSSLAIASILIFVFYYVLTVSNFFYHFFEECHIGAIKESLLNSILNSNGAPLFSIYSNLAKLLFHIPVIVVSFLLGNTYISLKITMAIWLSFIFFLWIAIITQEKLTSLLANGRLLKKEFWKNNIVVAIFAILFLLAPGQFAANSITAQYNLPISLLAISAAFYLLFNFKAQTEKKQLLILTLLFALSLVEFIAIFFLAYKIIVLLKSQQKTKQLLYKIFLPFIAIVFVTIAILIGIDYFYKTMFFTPQSFLRTFSFHFSNMVDKLIFFFSKNFAYLLLYLFVFFVAWLCLFSKGFRQKVKKEDRLLSYFLLFYLGYSILQGKLDYFLMTSYFITIISFLIYTQVLFRKKVFLLLNLATTLLVAVFFFLHADYKVLDKIYAKQFTTTCYQEMGVHSLNKKSPPKIENSVAFCKKFPAKKAQLDCLNGILIFQELDHDIDSLWDGRRPLDLQADERQALSFGLGMSMVRKGVKNQTVADTARRFGRIDYPSFLEGFFLECLRDLDFYMKDLRQQNFAQSSDDYKIILNASCKQREPYWSFYAKQFYDRYKDGFLLKKNIFQKYVENQEQQCGSLLRRCLLRE